MRDSAKDREGAKRIAVKIPEQPHILDEELDSVDPSQPILHNAATISDS